MQQRDIGNDVADLAFLQTSALQAHAHGIVLDQHLAHTFTQRRPAGLEGQLGVPDLEEQTETARPQRCALVQRALVLEVAFLDMAGANRCLQPMIEFGTHAGGAARQILLGVGRIAVAHANAQVHVAFRLRIAQQADQHVPCDLPFLAVHAHIGAVEGQASFTPVPAQPRLSMAITPGLGEKLIQVQGEVLGIQAQLAFEHVARGATADILCRRRTAIGLDAHLVQIGSELQTLGALALRVIIEQQVVDRANRCQRHQNLARLVGHRRQRLHQRRPGGEVETIGRQRPTLVSLPHIVLFQVQVQLADTLLTMAHGQGIDLCPYALLIPSEEGVEGQVLERHGLVPGLTANHCGSMQAQGALVQGQAAPFQPKLTAGLQALQLPVAEQCFRQPTRPIALRQAQIELRLGFAPGLRLHARAQAQRYRLAVGQQQTTVEALAVAAVAQAQIDVAEQQRLLIERLHHHAAVEQADAMHHLQLLEQSFDIQLGAVALWQSLQLPAALGVLLHVQLQTVDLQMGDARLACQQAAAHIRQQLHALQAQPCTLGPEAYIARHQHRREAPPTAFEAADPHRHAQLLGGAIFQFEAVFGHQRHQLTPQADVQRGQHQHGRAQPQAPAQQGREQAHQGALGTCGAQSSTTSYCSWEYMVSTWNLMVRPIKASRSATLPDSSSSRRSTTF